MQTSTAGRTRTTALVAAFTLLLLLIPLWPTFDAPGMAMDEGTLLLYPELILKGKLPYRDFETFYGPMNLWTLAGAYSVTGASIFAERTVGLLYHLLCMLGIFLIARRGGLVIAVGATVLTATLLRLALLPAYAWVGGVACAIWAVVLLAEAGKWRAFFGGLLGAGALLFRPDLGLAVLFSATPLVWRLSGNLRWRYCTGFAIGLLPLAGLTLAAGPAQVLNNLFIYPVLLCNPGRKLPFSTAAEWVQALVFLHLAASFCNVLAGALTWKKDSSSPQGPLLLSAALLGLGLTHQALQRVDSVHVALTAFFSIGLLPWSLHLLSRRGEAAEARPIRGLAWVGAALLCLSVSALPVVVGYAFHTADALTGSSRRGIFLKQRERQFPFASAPQALAAAKVLTLLEKEAAPGQRLFVGAGDLRRSYSNDTFLYHLASWLEPATYFLEMNPLSANRAYSRLASDVASADWLVLNSFWDRWKEPNESTRNGPDAPNEVVRQQFQLRQRIGSFEIYQRRAPAELKTAQVGRVDSL
ncbi:MAG: hypothetical protein QOE70_2229 [Chthoniobacter sp.]|jgi:hypothetical protein|nr:hypothetical protein [Chthoniobacter sp.]